MSILADAGNAHKRPSSAAERPGVATGTLAAERGVPRPARADAGEIAARIAVGCCIAPTRADNREPAARAVDTPGPRLFG